MAVNNFLRHMLAYRTENDLLEIALGFKQIVDAQKLQLALQELEHARCHRDLLANFLVVLDRPEDEDEIRETLHEALRDMSDQVARLEEHVG